MYVLFEDYSEKISYEQFKKIYRDEAWKHIPPTVEQYPYNLEFSLQFCKSNLDYSDICELRDKYRQGIPPNVAYIGYEKRISFQSFGNAYRGDTFKLVMPEVFTDENRHKTLSNAHSGSANGRAKLKEDDVRKIRQRFSSGEGINSISIDYPMISITSLRNIRDFKTWKDIK